MKNVIEELWDGNVCPNTDYYKMTVERKKLLGYITTHYDRLKETLTKEQWEVFEKFDDCHLELTSINEQEIFVYAFRLGARFMQEILTGD